MASAKDGLSGSLQSLLECPVCFEICISPIFQCRNGHVVCNECHGKLQECGICRVKLTSPAIRNLALEKLSEDVDVPCKYSVKGCTIKMKMQKLDFQYGSNSLATAKVPADLSPNPNQVNGFDRGFELAGIVGLMKHTATVSSFLLQWRGIDLLESVPTSICNIRCPEEVMEFYEKRITFHESENSSEDE